MSKHEDEFIHLQFFFNRLMLDLKEISILPICCNQHSIQWIVFVTNWIHLAVKNITIWIPVSFLYFLISFLQRAHLWAERLDVPYIAKHARKWSRHYLCSRHFSETNFILAEKIHLARLKVVICIICTKSFMPFSKIWNLLHGFISSTAWRVATHTEFRCQKYHVP